MGVGSSGMGWVSQRAALRELTWWSYFQAFGQSFLQPDIHLFKQNLFYLETLNTKQKLYHKVSASLSQKESFIQVFLRFLAGEWDGEEVGTWAAPGA